MIHYIQLHKEDYHLLTNKHILEMCEVAQKAFGPTMEREEVEEHILPTDFLVVGYTDRIVGFSTAQITKDSIDLVGAAIEPSYQGNGLYQHLTSQRILFGLRRSRSIAEFRTQNQRVEHGKRRSLDTLIQAGFLQRYEIERNKKLKFYGRMLTDQQPISSQEDINEVYSSLDYTAGDAFEFRMSLQVPT